MKIAAILTGLCGLFFSFANVSEAVMNDSALNPKHEAMICISAFSASGDLDKLKTALGKGLDAGLTVNEIKEILVQVYAYAGFPRSLNAIGVFMGVMDERQKKGVKDDMGREPGPMPTDRTSLAFGTDNQTKLIGQPVTGPIYDFAPAIDQFLKAHLFGDIFQRDNLDWLSREIVTIAILANIEGLNPQLHGHYAIAMHNGLTEQQARSFVAVLERKVGASVAGNAGKVLDAALAARR